MDRLARGGTSTPLTEEHKERLMKNLALARQLGAEIIHQVGDDLAQVIIDVANKENVTQIIIVKTIVKNWQRFLGVPTLAVRLVSLSGQIDVHMVRMSSTEKTFPEKQKYFLSKLRPHEYGLCLLMFAMATVVNMFLAPLTGYQPTGLMYLLDRCLKWCFLRQVCGLYAGGFKCLGMGLFIYTSKIHLKS